MFTTKIVTHNEIQYEATKPLSCPPLEGGPEFSIPRSGNDPSPEFLSSHSFANKFVLSRKGRGMCAAFTLAEVLITLAIIGVVAALTIPTLVQKYKERETVTRVKEFYSVFSQAYQLAILEHGTFDQWNLGNTVRIDNEDGSTSLDENSLNNVNKFFDIMKKYLKYDSYIAFDSSNSGTDANGVSMSAYGKRGLLLANGTWITAISLTSSECSYLCGDFYITTDTGFSTEQREDGKSYAKPQTFVFTILKDRIGMYKLTQAQFENACIHGNDYSRCTEWVIKNGNMDYLHCDDLEIDGKNKCD